MIHKMDWNECLRRNAKPISRDEDIIKSLMESAEPNLEVAKSIKQEDKSYPSIIVLAYDSLRMLLEALALQNGYKIYNHECYTCFLREILKLDSMADKFDTARVIRNSINYYGKRLNKYEFDLIYRDILYLILEIKKLLEKDG